MSDIFSYCKSLTSLPYISKWNINNVTNMTDIFSYCKSLTSLPDISKWNINNNTNMSDMFEGCISLVSLPDISKWNRNNVSDPYESLLFSSPIIFGDDFKENFMKNLAGYILDRYIII